ncbi:MAG: AsmA family protein [Methylobacter sp.]
MGKPLKIILSAVAAMMLLLIIAVCILPFVIDPNDFKPEITAAVKEKTGRELVLDGDLKLSLFPWVGISTGRAALGNTPEFQDRLFASIDEGHIQVLLLPLLSKNVEVSNVVLKGLVINLAKNKQGIANWDDLTSPTSEPAVAVTGTQNQQPVLTVTPTIFSIGGITIENARINWDDLESEKHIQLKDLNLNTDKFTFDKPVNITVSMTALNDQSKSIQDIKLNSELNVNEQFDNFSLQHSELQITASGETISGKSLTAALTAADIAVDMNQQTAKISGLQLKSGDLVLSAELTGHSIKDKSSFRGPVTVAPFSPVKILQQLAITVPAMQDANALGKLSAGFDLTATADSADLQNLVLNLDDSQIKGAITVKDFAQSIVCFNLAIDALDADRYLPPADKSAKPIASPAVMLAAGLSALPVESLRKLNAEGTVSLGKLKVNGLTMQDIRLNLNSKDGAISSQQSVKRFYQGSYSGNLNMDMHRDKPALAVNEKLDHVQIEPLLKDYKGEADIGGLVNVSAQLQGQGRKAEELKASLNGQLSFLFKDGMIKGFNLQKIIDQGKALFKGSALPSDSKNDQTLFSEMSGTATIANGLIRNDDLVATSSKLRVDGKGSLNLNSEALDYRIDAKLLDSDAAIEPKPVKGAVAINIAGTLDNPAYTIDIASLLNDKTKAKVDKLIDKLDKKVGPGLGNLLKSLLH